MRHCWNISGWVGTANLRTSRCFLKAVRNFRLCNLGPGMRPASPLSLSVKTLLIADTERARECPSIHFFLPPHMTHLPRRVGRTSRVCRAADGGSELRKSLMGGSKSGPAGGGRGECPVRAQRRTPRRKLGALVKLWRHRHIPLFR